MLRSKYETLQEPRVALVSMTPRPYAAVLLLLFINSCNIYRVSMSLFSYTTSLFIYFTYVLAYAHWRGQKIWLWRGKMEKSCDVSLV